MSQTELNGLLKIQGNSFSIELPGGERYYNNLNTMRAFVNGQLKNSAGYTKTYLRTVRSSGGLKQ